MLDLLVDMGAVYRLTRLAVTDGIFETPRHRLITWASTGPTMPRHPKLAEFIQCPWCVSLWAGAGVVAARSLVPRAWRPIATALALSAAAGYISTQLEE